MEHVCCSSVMARAKCRSSAAMGQTRSICATAFCAGLLLIVSLAMAHASDTQFLNDNTKGYDCPQSGLTIYASDDDLVLRACKVSQTASRKLASCGLSLRPSIDLHIVHEIHGAAAHCLGLYVCETDEIAVLHPATLANSAQGHASYRSLAPIRLFESLIVHELAHAKLAHLLQDRELSLATHEYVAYAMQLDWLSEEERAKLLVRAPANAVDPTTINEFVLSFDPELFLGLVWRHFETPGNGCDYVKSLISGSEQLGFPAID